ncbi:MAG: amylo-alpha-1,6-glucosidase [Bacteroidales bacterium]|nr:amylo-alpha-1,6-glucosidase [Bacteroidales bacterium]
MKKILVMLGGCMLWSSVAVGQPVTAKRPLVPVREMAVDRLAIEVTKGENREYSFTDKKSGFWYGRTHQDVPIDWYAGWNIAKKRVLSDYTLYLDGRQMKRAEAKHVSVSPTEIRRTWGEQTEILRLFDNDAVIAISVNGCKKSGITLTFPDGADKAMVHVYRADGKKAKQKKGMWMGAEGETTLLLIYGTEAEADALAQKYANNWMQQLMQRKIRINGIVDGNNQLQTNLPELDKAIAWITATMDELITEQQGKGIYAGLPWFNEYWGRDMFIAMPGATLVTGQFNYTKDILKDFSKFQDRDPNSPTCGRIPNRANLEGILYNTADGTPRYVMEAEELLQYCGDRTFLRHIYPSIVLSTQQSLLHHTDARGYLMHADADTWMDVKRKGIPGSPRGNRANDIQYLWWKQLTAASHLATLMNDSAHAKAWQAAAEKVARNFEADFCDKEGILIYDHLNADGTPDLQMRPNQLYCFDLISDEAFKQKVTRRCWEELVYPWGVASLSQTDKQFHPQHENWNYYHKDDAYHNGTIWLWNNGMAMQRMIEYGQKEMAWQLFKNMNRQALHEGAVGSLSENADAHPRKGKTWVDRSGTFLQAWSNSEHLRVWYQHFLGIRPDLMNGVVVVEPRLPKEITYLLTTMRIGNGRIVYNYSDGKFNISLEDLPGVKLDLRIASDEEQEAAAKNPIFEGIDFCQPKPLDHYPCFDKYYDPPLTYE